MCAVADPGGGGQGGPCPPWPVKIGHKKIAAMWRQLIFHVSWPPLSEVSGSATGGGGGGGGWGGSADDNNFRFYEKDTNEIEILTIQFQPSIYLHMTEGTYLTAPNDF